MKGVRLPDGEQPVNPGEYSWMEYNKRQIHHPDENGKGEWWVVDPNGALYRLVSTVHSWTIHDDGSITITPSIVAPRRGYHGFLVKGTWS